MDILTIKKNYILVSRASTGIYLILKSKGIYKKKILLPANICYAAIYPVVYSGNEPVFCDVSEITGNLTLDLIKNVKSDFSAIIIPHMYGNPISEIETIYQYCKKKNILVIEDCASAMGASIGDRLCGTFGDYAIFSTGYSKTIDVGGGGIILSDYDMKAIADEYKKLPLLTEIDSINEQFFSKLYRLIRNSKEQTLDTEIFKGILNSVKNIFIHQTSKFEKRILKELNELGFIIDERRKAQKIYETELCINDMCALYNYSEGAVPWRFNLLVDSNFHQKMINYLLERKMPVSDWYPVSTVIFGDKTAYCGAKKMEDKIINFPLLIDHEEIKCICATINQFWMDMEE